MVSVHVIDNVLDEHTRNEYIRYINENEDKLKSLDLFVHDSYQTFINENTEIGSIFRIAERYFDLSSAVGYERWFNIDRKFFTWHLDRDERFFSSTGQNKFPICTLIYYPFVDESMEGGNLLLKINDYGDLAGFEHIEFINKLKDNEKDMVIRPRNNRLVIFPPGIYHTVENFAGYRYSIVINPWSYDITSNWASGEVGESHQTVNLAPSAE